jgi:transposase
MSMSNAILANYDQIDLLPQSLEDYVDRDHPARFIREFVDAMDVSELGFRERRSEEGRPPYANDLLLKVWLYGYLARIRSTRELDRACREHLSLLWLTGRHAPDHNTLWRFWHENRPALREVFRAGVKVAAAQGLVGMICQAVDGTKIRAVASRRTVEHGKDLEKVLKRVEASIAEMEAAEQEEAGEYRLPERLQEAEKLRSAIRESLGKMREIQQSGGSYAPSHNLQISTDAAHSLIVGVSVPQAVGDGGQLPPALDEVRRNLGRLPRQVVADAGYTAHETILAMAERQVDFIGGTVEVGRRSQPRPGVDPAFRAGAFVYKAEGDVYRCPAGKELPRRGIQRTRVGVQQHVYQAKVGDCRGCAFRPQGCAGAGPRTVSHAQNAPTVEAFRAKMQTAAAQAIYRLRAAVAEFPPAWLKAKIGLRQFRARGLKRVRAEALWACSAYNLAQWARLRWRVRPAGTEA